jgi:protein involved in polysaccharide export with SLBB domain
VVVIRICGSKIRPQKIILGLALIAGCPVATLAADTVTGVARNRTLGQFASGDEVILLRLDQGMQEEARTKTDSQGSFALKVRFTDKPHLLRVLHQGVNYDQQVSAGDAVSVDVFEAAAKVQGLAGSIEIIRTGTKGDLLHVSDMIEIRNDSSPPLTQAGERTFEVYLPTHAKIDSVLAASSGKMGVRISATPVPGEPGHFTVNFPLRPGATKFAFNYDLPYDGHATFRTRRLYPVQQLAVMIPPTMKFSSRSPAFQVLPTGNSNYQVQAANRVNAGEGPEFEISGAGALPALQARAQPPPEAASTVASPAPQRVNASGTVAGSGLSAPVSRRKWWVLGVGGFLVLGAGGLWLWRGERLSASASLVAEGVGPGSACSSEVLKEELFRLEIDRLHGTISGEEYDSARQALEGTIKRALARAGAKT